MKSDEKVDKKPEDKADKPEEKGGKDDEPKIEEVDDKPKKAPKSIYKFKIEPPLDYYPAHGAIKKQAMIKIREMFNEYKFEQAQKEVEALKLDELIKKAEEAKKSEDIEGYLKLKLRSEYWQVKKLFELGEMKKCQPLLED